MGWAPEQDWEEAQFAGQEKVLVWEFTVVLPRKRQFSYNSIKKNKILRANQMEKHPMYLDHKT